MPSKRVKGKICFNPDEGAGGQKKLIQQKIQGTWHPEDGSPATAFLCRDAVIEEASTTPIQSHEETGFMEFVYDGIDQNPREVHWHPDSPDGREMLPVKVLLVERHSSDKEPLIPTEIEKFFETHEDLKISTPEKDQVQFLANFLWLEQQPDKTVIGADHKAQNINAALGCISKAGGYWSDATAACAGDHDEEQSNPIHLPDGSQVTPNHKLAKYYRLRAQSELVRALGFLMTAFDEAVYLPKKKTSEGELQFKTPAPLKKDDVLRVHEIDLCAWDALERLQNNFAQLTDYFRGKNLVPKDFAQKGTRPIWNNDGVLPEEDTSKKLQNPETTKWERISTACIAG